MIVSEWSGDEGIVIQESSNTAGRWGAGWGVVVVTGFMGCRVDSAASCSKQPVGEFGQAV
ncbi:MAG: hypothetical protein CMJ68_06145 [Planctomycetaceae bacterium]|nr:hypothetical protein [Planctomycetaceae bacterium]